MKGVNKINHKGKEILYLDYRGLTQDEIVACMTEAERLVLAESKPQLILTNFSEAFATPKVMHQAGQLRDKTVGRVKKSAILGVSGAKSLVLKGFNRALESAGMLSFESEQEALEYLVS